MAYIELAGRAVQKQRAPRPGGRWIILVGKIRALVALRRERDIPISRKNVAMVIAAERAATDQLSTLELRYWVRWVGLGEMPVELAQATTECAFRTRTVARSRGLQQSLSRQELGRLLDLTTVERDELEFWWPEAIDETPAEGRKRRAVERAARRAAAPPVEAERLTAIVEERRRKDARRKRAKRRAEGSARREHYEENSLSRQQPWKAFGWCRRTWERKGKPAPGPTGAQSDASSSTVASVSVGGLSGGKKITPATSADVNPAPSVSGALRGRNSMTRPTCTLPWIDEHPLTLGGRPSRAGPRVPANDNRARETKIKLGLDPDADIGLDDLPF